MDKIEAVVTGIVLGAVFVILLLALRLCGS